MGGIGVESLGEEETCCDLCELDFEEDEQRYRGTFNGSAVTVCQDCALDLDDICDGCSKPIYGDAVLDVKCLSGKHLCQECAVKSESGQLCSNCSQPIKHDAVDGLCERCYAHRTDTGHLPE